MKIRHKINLWITSLGLLINLIFAGIILFEAAELPYETLDEELEAEVRQDITKLISMQSAQNGITMEMTEETLSKFFDFDERYWIKVFDPDNVVMFSSQIAKKIAIPYVNTNKGYTIRVLPPPLNPEQAEGEYHHPVPFRVNLLTVTLNNEQYKIQIARAVEEIDKEVHELVRIIVIGFIVAAVVLVLLSSLLTEKILKPIIKINRLVEKITINNMAGRIPLGKSKDELYDLSNALNHMFDRLEKSFLTQKQWIADAAHELKNPVTILQLSMERSMEQPDISPKYLDKLNSQIQILRRMGRLVKDLLEISKLDLKESLQCTRFDFEEMVKTVLEDFAPLFDDRNIAVHTRIPKKYKLVADREKMLRLLINLLDNAVKYNRLHGAIDIELREVPCEKGLLRKRSAQHPSGLFGTENELSKKTTTPPDHEIHITIWNSGMGIPTQDLTHVFKTFYRVEKSRSQKYGGAGLGLTIVDKIIRLHGGSITMESEPGEWCRATVILPLIQFSLPSDELSNLI